MNDGRRTTLPVDVTLTINDLPPKTAMRRIRRQIGAAGLVTRRDWWVLWLITASVVAVNLAQSVDIAALRHDVHRLQHSHVAPPAAAPSPGPTGSMSPRPRVSPSAASRSRQVGGYQPPAVTVDLTGIEQRIAGCESVGNPSGVVNWRAKNPHSTASGGFQFLDSSWVAATGLKPPASAYPASVQIAAFVSYSHNGTWLQPWAASEACWGRS